MDDNLIKWAIELQGLAQSALHYCTNAFDIERFERIRAISAEMMAYKSDMPVEKIKDLFCNEVGYQTPKIDTRAATIKDGKVLLVQENSGKWTLPGGWADMGYSLSENALKELREEAGVVGRALNLIAVIDKSKNSLKKHPYGIYSFLFLCEYVNGDFIPNAETTSSGFFELDNLPPLETIKTSRDIIELAFEAYKSPCWKAVFE